MNIKVGFKIMTYQTSKLYLLLFTALIIFSCKNKTPVKIEAPKPNLLFIFADQYRQASLGFLNEDPVYTPNIDKLAKEGVFFSEAVANNPLCSPYRAMLMTGRYSLSTGVVENCNSQRNQNPGRSGRADTRGL